jgi:hypothetical protein
MLLTAQCTFPEHSANCTFLVSSRTKALGRIGYCLVRRKNFQPLQQAPLPLGIEKALTQESR